jgi:broad specificity phosphatase PhoE
MPRLYLARHGETDWNAGGKLQGHTDVPLNLAGRDQAGLLARKLKDERLGSVTTSDLSRAKETGALVASTLGITTLEVDADLRERRFGIFEGLTRDECASGHPAAWRAWLERAEAPPGGEARELVVARVTRAMLRIAARAAESPALVVSHGGAMRLWLIDLLSAPVPLIGNGAVYVVELDGQRFRAAEWGPELP